MADRPKLKAKTKIVNGERLPVDASVSVDVQEKPDSTKESIDYKFNAGNETIDQYNTRIATARGVGSPTMDEAFNLPELDTGDDLARFEKESLATASAPIDQEKIRRSYLSQFQDQINALNQVYDQQLAQARQEGVGRIGSGTAVLARRGLGGSPRGEAIKEQVLDKNRQVEGAIQAERAVAIQAIFGKATELAQKEAAELRAAKQKGATDYIEFVKGRNERKATNASAVVAALIAQGVDPNEMGTEELAAIASRIGVAPSSLLSSYQQSKAAEDKAAKEAEAKAARDGIFTLNEGEARYDAEGNVIAYRPKTYAPKEAKGTSASDIKAAALSGYSQAFTPGAYSGDVPTVDANGFATPAAWREAITEAPDYDISRKEFIEGFGHLLFRDKNGNIDRAYGLTPQEQKLVTGTT